MGTFQHETALIRKLKDYATMALRNFHLILALVVTRPQAALGSLIRLELGKHSLEILDGIPHSGLR